MTDQATSESAPRRVAIIGVHGVAHHDPGETANAMADLLISLPSFDPTKAGEPCSDRTAQKFGSFDSKGLQIPLQPVCINEDERVDPQGKHSPLKSFRLQEGSYKFALDLSEKKDRIGKNRGEIGRRWSMKLLQDYYGAADSNKYVTTRLEGQRSDSTEVHIYEMFWADLARPTNSALSFLLALFQFILHVPSLSRLAIDSKPNPDGLWKVLQAVHRYASRILQMALPLAKVMLLIVIAAAIPAVTDAKNLNLISAVVAGLVVAVAILLLTIFKRKPIFRFRTEWLVACFLLPILLLIGLILYFNHAGNSPEIVVLSAAIWVLGAGLTWWALDAYQDTRPGIKGWGWMVYVVALVGFAVSCGLARCLHKEASYWIQQASFWTVQWTLVFLRLFWIALALLAIVSSTMGAIVWRRAGSESEKSKAKAAVRTSRFALAMPAFLFAFVTAFIWAALFSIAHKINNPFFDQVAMVERTQGNWTHNFDLFPYKSIANGFPEDCKDKTPTCVEPHKECPTCPGNAKPEYLKGVLAWSIGYGSYLVVLITLLGLIVLVWWAVPSVLTETFPPRRRVDWYAQHHTEPPRNSTNAQAMWMGGWTSRGLDSISLVTWLAWLAIFLVPLAFLYLGPRPQWLNFLEGFRAYSRCISKMVVSRAIAVASTTAILAALVHYSSPVLRVILDVDTYLRTGPIEATPRAKIFERYVSLLRYIAQYRDGDGRGYDHVVIVAHSLGALISGDLLNLLQHQRNDPGLNELGFGPKPEMDTISIDLFTMGNPLRQLLNRFFPYLYDWVRDNPDNGATPLGSPLETPPANIDELLPNPQDLGVQKWVSAYRSGDYVGRSLWLDEWYQRTSTGKGLGIYPDPLLTIPSKDGTRKEFCIGAGAHTHYWDDTAPDIADELNKLI